MRKTIQKVGFQLLILLVGISLISLGIRFGLGTWTPFYVVVGRSMLPTLREGDVVIIQKPNSLSEVKVGDIIVFKDPFSSRSTNLFEQERVIVHRVIAVISDSQGNKAFLTKGDNMSMKDPWVVSEKHFLGKVVFWIPKLGFVATLIRPPINYLLITLIIIYIIVSEFGLRKQ